MKTALKNLNMLLVAAVVTIGWGRALAGDVKIIANSSVQADAISANDLKRIYLRETSSLKDGTHVEPVLEKSGSAHEAFLKEFLDMSDEALQTYYRTLVFTGRGSMPKAFGSDAEVVAYVARTKGAIGYVSTATGAEGVKLVPVLSDRHEARRAVITRVAPEYPETLKRLHIGGTVRLAITISPKGNVEQVVLLGGNPILAEAAITAVKQWVYASGHSRTTTEVSVPFDADR